jgi:TonB-dependent SusC/RagA subfamily outer membrane receptor
LVNLASGINSTHLIHNFNSNIKNRIAMINKTSTPGIAALKTIFILPAIIILFCLFSFKSSTSIQEKKENPSVFSAESKKKLIDLIYTNISYPSEARKQDLTGKFYVIVKMKKGGIVDQVSVSENDKGVTVPLLANEVVIMGYGSKRPEESADNKAVVKDKSLLTNEGIRVAKMLGSVKIPEWENKDLEFAINFKFDLNYPDPLPVKVSDIGSAIIMLDGKEITKKEYGDLNPSTISTVSVLKDKSATAVFGEKGKNGVVVVTTKK